MLPIMIQSTKKEWSNSVRHQ